MTKCSLRQTCFLGLAAAVLAASVVACGDNRDNNGVIKKPKDAGEEADSGGMMGTDTGVPPITDSGIPPGNDSGVPPGNDAGLPAFDGGMLTGDMFNPT